MRTSRRRRPRASALAIVMIVGGVGGLILGTGAARADVDSAQARAFGAFVGGTLTILPETPVTSLSANESTPPAGLGPFENITLDINLPGILRVPVLRSAVQAGNLAGDDHSGFAAALAEVTNPSVGLDAITADAIASSCTSNGDGSSGNTTVANLRIGTNTLLNGPIAPNTQIVVPGVLSVILNEQIVVDGPGSTSIIVRGAHVQLLPSPLLPTAVLDVILAESRCAVQGPDVLVQPTTSTTTGPTTSSTTGPTTSTTTGPTTSTTTGPTTSTTTGPTTSTTTGPTTSTTTGPTTSTTIVSTTTSTTNVSPTVATTAPTTTILIVTPLPRTGGDIQPLVVLSAISVVLGLLLLIGSGRPVTATGGARAGTAVVGPEKWGPAEIVKAIGGGLANVWVSALRRLKR
ncbi:MAG: choice-of-anchor P family protein [Acidimicrobiales bacterium]